MSTEVKKPEVTIDTIFNATDADLALIWKEPSDDGLEPNLHVFKVHGKILAVPLTVFEDMLAASTDTSGEIEGLEGVPEVKLEEEPAVVTVILGAAYNKSELLFPVIAGTDWEVALKVWEAANKYSFHVLKGLASFKIQCVCL